MKIWFDADNAPHVLVMQPIVDELIRRGHSVHFTARNRASTCELLDLYGFDYIVVGGKYGKSKISKIQGTIKRALALKNVMKKLHVDVSFGHGSRALPIASSMLNVPSVTMYDYEWVNPFIFNRFCKTILLPDVISTNRCLKAGISTKKIRFFPGLKENLYLNNVCPDPSIGTELGLKKENTVVLLRPPATTAHYHNPKTEEILGALLDRILDNAELQILWLPRTPEQNNLLPSAHRAEVIIPEKVYPGSQLVLSCDMVIGGGGTMTRESAVLGVPSVSFFSGTSGAADTMLEKMGRLHILRDIREVDELTFNQPRQTVLNLGGNPLEIIVDSILTG